MVQNKACYYVVMNIRWVRWLLLGAADQRRQPTKLSFLRPNEVRAIKSTYLCSPASLSGQSDGVSGKQRLEEVVLSLSRKMYCCPGSLLFSIGH